MKLTFLLATGLVAAAVHAQSPAPQAAASAAAKGAMDMKPMMQNMNQDMMDMPMSGNPDRDFAMMMRRHHQGGIDMAKEYLKHGKDGKLRGMAQKMISQQTKERTELGAMMEKHGGRK
jgi:uncharacterized protein (DUF305 family)